MDARQLVIVIKGNNNHTGKYSCYAFSLSHFIQCRAETHLRARRRVQAFHVVRPVESSTTVSVTATKRKYDFFFLWHKREWHAPRATGASERARANERGEWVRRIRSRTSIVRKVVARTFIFHLQSATPSMRFAVSFNRSTLVIYIFVSFTSVRAAATCECLYCVRAYNGFRCV